jgi:hypothetical protein
MGQRGFQDGEDLPEFITQPDLAVKLGRSLSTLRWWRHAGRGPKSFLLGGRVVYKLEDVEAWIQGEYDKAEGQRAS